MPEDVATYLFDSGVIVGLYYGVILWDYTIYGPMGLDYVIWVFTIQYFGEYHNPLAGKCLFTSELEGRRT